MSKAHPRSRGENPLTKSLGDATEGSSPLTRGKHAQPAPDHKARRLIPAHAGKTPGGCSSHRPAWAHPRSRGENFD
ncbi:hypothetical protein ACTODO_00510 [Schaalia dentiphila ATCC 17982]|nr:hypothetical protein ACTODO_00510 [Schaalia odontolytica ATCC 17982]